MFEITSLQVVIGSLGNKSIIKAFYPGSVVTPRGPTNGLILWVLVAVPLFYLAEANFVKQLRFDSLGSNLPFATVGYPLEGRKDLMLQPFQFAPLAANYIDVAPEATWFQPW